MNNPLMDKDFLRELDEFNSHIVYARLTSLTMQELPLERIEGKVTGGSINIDGTSAIRRTCSLSMVASDVNINNFYCGLHTKFKLEIGLQNDINPQYPDIIWFPQGIYIVTTFNTSYTTSGFNISITGKDKMCLLNGEVGGSLPHSVDFGVKEYYDLDTLTTTYEKVPIWQIIKEAVHTYALEPYGNIIINDLENHALELLEYRCEDPAFMLAQVGDSNYSQFVQQGDKECWIASTGQKTTIDNLPSYNARIDDLTTAAQGTVIYTSNPKTTPSEELKKFIVTKIEYGQTAGYRLTDLVYAGDLISGIGESLTSVLDKIVTMLGNFEYFYDLDGRFVFQAKKTYLNTTWNSIVNINNDPYAENAEYISEVSYNFEGNKLISSFSNTPNINNVRNDYSIWGTRTTVSGAEIPIHYRYAIHTKPKRYFSIKRNKLYTDEMCDWRELIYLMALDYYQYNEEGLDGVPLDTLIRRNNPEDYPTGMTGYEQFYIDMEGFWRQLYNPEYIDSPKYLNFWYSKVDGEKTVESEEELFIKEKYIPWDEVEDLNRGDVVVIKQIEGTYEIQSLIDTIAIDYNFDSEGNQNTYFVTTNSDEGYKAITESIYKKLEKKEIYIKDGEEYVSVLNAVQLDNSCFVVDQNAEYISVNDLPSKVLPIYKSQNGMYNKYYTKHKLDLLGQPTEKVETYYLNYYTCSYDYYEEGQELQYWNKNIVEAPDLLNFWIDFLDSSSELDKFNISIIGDRPKVVNDDKVTSIYFRDIPNVIFTTGNETSLTDYQEKTGYIFMQLDSIGTNSNGALEFNYFTISAQGKSAKEELDEQLYNHSYCTESVNISTIPIYYLEPNTKIYIRDEKSQINGEYIVSRLTVPLTYNGTMQITATKAPERLL